MLKNYIIFFLKEQKNKDKPEARKEVEKPMTEGQKEIAAMCEDYGQGKFDKKDKDQTNEVKGDKERKNSGFERRERKDGQR